VTDAPASPTWDDRHRDDGLLIAQGLEGEWIILPGDDRPAIDQCRHCGQTQTITAARTVADLDVPPLRRTGL